MSHSRLHRHEVAGGCRQPACIRPVEFECRSAPYACMKKSSSSCRGTKGCFGFHLHSRITNSLRKPDHIHCLQRLLCTGTTRNTLLVDSWAFATTSTYMLYMSLLQMSRASSSDLLQHSNDSSMYNWCRQLHVFRVVSLKDLTQNHCTHNY